MASRAAGMADSSTTVATDRSAERSKLTQPWTVVAGIVHVSEPWVTTTSAMIRSAAALAARTTTSSWVGGAAIAAASTMTSDGASGRRTASRAAAWAVDPSNFRPARAEVVTMPLASIAIVASIGSRSSPREGANDAGGECRLVEHDQRFEFEAPERDPRLGKRALERGPGPAGIHRGVDHCLDIRSPRERAVGDGHIARVRANHDPAVGVCAVAGGKRGGRLLPV